MRQLTLPFRDDAHNRDIVTVVGSTPAELAILAELAEESYLASLTTPEARQRHFARLAAEERRRVAESRRR